MQPLHRVAMTRPVIRLDGLGLGVIDTGWPPPLSIFGEVMA